MFVSIVFVCTGSRSNNSNSYPNNQPHLPLPFTPCAAQEAAKAGVSSLERWFGQQFTSIFQHVAVDTTVLWGLIYLLLMPYGDNILKLGMIRDAQAATRSRAAAVQHLQDQARYQSGGRKATVLYISELLPPLVGPAPNGAEGAVWKAFHDPPPGAPIPWRIATEVNKSGEYLTSIETDAQGKCADKAAEAVQVVKQAVASWREKQVAQW